MKRTALLVTMLALAVGMLSAQNIFGAFKITTQPQGAIVSLFGTNQYLGTSPNILIPVQMDQSMVYVGGRPGRMLDLLISKPGYISMRQQIFVPYTKKWERDALRNPSVYHFTLQLTPPPPVWNYGYPAYYYPITNPPGHGHGYGHGNHHPRPPKPPSGPGHKPPSGGSHGPGGPNPPGNNQGGHGSHSGKPRP